MSGEQVKSGFMMPPGSFREAGRGGGGEVTDEAG